MLILTRRVGQILKIGDDVEIIALGMKDGRIRLGITAPRNVSVHRMEIYEKINGLDPASTRLSKHPSMGSGTRSAHRSELD
jgi:carbon storage regulator